MKGDTLQGKIQAQAIMVVFVLLLILGFTFWNTRTFHSTPVLPYASTTPSITSSLIHLTPGVETWYTNEKLHFSFRLPDGFTAGEARTNISSAQAVIVENALGDKLLIAALHVKDTSTHLLNLAGIQANAPGETITNLREGVISSVVNGLAFDTDAKEWGGDGTAFWFVNQDYLYEINTFKKDQELLDYVRSTWLFAPPQPPHLK